MVDEVNTEGLSGDSGSGVTDTSNIQQHSTIESVIADSQQENSNLRQALTESEIKVKSLERDVEKFKAEAERESNKRKVAIEEKKDMLGKVKYYQDMHEGVDDETAMDLLKRARDGDADDWEVEKRRIWESAEQEFMANKYEPILDELQETKEKLNSFKSKLHDSVIKTEISTNLMKFGVETSLAHLAVNIFESRMKIDENGNRVYLNKEGLPTSAFDWKTECSMLKREMPALFRKSMGSTSNPSIDTDPLGEVNINPWKKGTIRRDLQIKLLSEDRARANKYRVEAGLAPV